MTELERRRWAKREMKNLIALGDDPPVAEEYVHLVLSWVPEGEDPSTFRPNEDQLAQITRVTEKVIHSARVSWYASPRIPAKFKRLLDASSFLLEADWDESLHPREPAGTPEGGRFAGGGGGGRRGGDPTGLEDKAYGFNFNSGPRRSSLRKFLDTPGRVELFAIADKNRLADVANLGLAPGQGSDSPHDEFAVLLYPDREQAEAALGKDQAVVAVNLPRTHEIAARLIDGQRDDFRATDGLRALHGGEPVALQYGVEPKYLEGAAASSATEQPSAIADLRIEVFGRDPRTGGTIASLLSGEDTFLRMSEQIEDWDHDRHTIASMAIAANSIDYDVRLRIYSLEEGYQVTAVASVSDSYEDALSIDYLASRQDGQGRGTALMAQVARAAAEEGKGVMLQSVASARTYYEHLGMHQVGQSANVYEWTAAEAKAFAEAYGEAIQ